MMRSLSGSGAVAVRPPRHPRAAGSPQQQGQGPQGTPNIHPGPCTGMSASHLPGSSGRMTRNCMYVCPSL